MEKLAICSMVKDEEDSILEWMSFHLAAGASRLIIFDDQSTDSTKKIINLFGNATGKVECISSSKRFSQVDTFQILLDHCRVNFEWAAFIDSDEFLFCPNGNSLSDSLDIYKEYGGLGVFWLLYGSSYFLEKPDGLTIERFLRRSNVDHYSNHHIKTIVNLKYAIRPITAHFFETTQPIIDEAFDEFLPTPPHGLFLNRAPLHSRFRINHYHTKSHSQYLQKARRGYSYGGQMSGKLQTSEHVDQMFAAHDLNDEFDSSALIHRDAVLAILDQFQAARICSEVGEPASEEPDSNLKSNEPAA